MIGVETEFYPALYAEMKGEATIIGGVTIAEGIAVEKVGRLPLSIVRDVVRDVLLVSEPAIEAGIAFLLEDEKLVAEGAGAAGVAAIRNNVERFRGKRIGTLLERRQHRSRDARVGHRALAHARRPRRANSRADGRQAGRPRRDRDRGQRRRTPTSSTCCITGLFGSVPAKYAQLDLTCELQRPEDIEQILANIAERGYEAEVIAG